MRGSPRDPQGRAFAPLADVYRRLGRLDEALELLQEGLARSPDFASGHVVAGWVHQARGEEGAAESSFRRVLELDPLNVAALRGLAGILEERGELDEALELWRRLLDQEPDDTRLADRIRELEARLTEEAEAMAPGEVVIAGATDPAASVWEGEAAAEEIDWARASLQADESGGEEPAVVQGEDEPVPPGPERERPGEDALMTRTMAEIYVRQGLLDQALEVFEHLLERSPGDEELVRRVEEVRALAAEEEGRPGLGVLEPRPAERERGPAPAGEVTGEGGALEVVPIQALAPDASPGPAGVVPIEALAPDEPSPEEGPLDVVPIQALAPDASPEPEPAGVVAIEALAPDEFPPEESPLDVVPIEALAPDASPEPAGVVPIEALAPEIVPIESLAPDGPEGTEGGGDDGAGMDGFRNWLDSLT